MQLINYINENIIKYIYIVLGIILLFFIIKLLTRVVTSSKQAKQINKPINNINNSINNINNDIDKINYTINNSLPTFTKTAFGITLFRSIIKDYKQADNSQKNILKSSIKQYKRLRKKA